LANELSTLEQTGKTTFADVDYSANAAESVSSRFADLETAKAEAPEAVDIEAPKPNPNRTLPLSATQKALLDAIADVESGGKWNVIVGGKTFNNYDDHPRVVGVVTEHGPSTAAGRYQIVATTYDDEAKRLGLKGFSPDVQDVIALNLAERNYKEATGRDIYKDLESGRADDVRRVLAGKGAATTWQGLQKDNNFSERFNNYRKQYASGGDGWHPPMPARKPADNIPVDQPPAETQQTSVTSANKPAPSSVTTGVVKKDTEIEKVDTKLDDGLSGIDPATLPADLRKKYDEIKTKRAVLTERFSELQQRASTRVDELQPTFEETQEYKDAFANYEKSVNDLATEVLTGVVEKTNGYNSLKLRLEHQVRNNIISVEYANKQLTDYINKSLGSQPEYLDAKKKLDDDFNTGYKGLIETYITNDPVYQEINKEITDLQKKADEEGAVFSKEWDDTVSALNKSAELLSCGPDIPEEECQKATSFSKINPSSYDIEKEVEKYISNIQNKYNKEAAEKTKKRRGDIKTPRTSGPGEGAARAGEAVRTEVPSVKATYNDIPADVRQRLEKRKNEALRNEFMDFSPINFGLQYITDAETKRKEYFSDERGNWTVETQALGIYMSKLRESKDYTDGILKSKYGDRYDKLLGEITAISSMVRAGQDASTKSMDITKKYEDILNDKDFQYVFKQIPQYMERALEDEKEINLKYGQKKRLDTLKAEQVDANMNTLKGMSWSLLNGLTGAGATILGSVMETAADLARKVTPDFLEPYMVNPAGEVGELLRVTGSDLAKTPLPESMQGQATETSSTSEDGYKVVWDGNTGKAAYIRNPDGTFFKGTEDQSKAIVDSVKGKPKETTFSPITGLGHLLQSAPYMAGTVALSGLAYVTGGTSAAALGAFLAGYAQMRATMYEEMLAQPNVKVDDAKLLAAGFGAVAGGLETLNPFETGLVVKYLSPSLIKSNLAKYAAGQATYKDLMAEGALGFVKGGFKETVLEELPQNYVESAFKKMANSQYGANFQNLDMSAENLVDLVMVTFAMGGGLPAAATVARGRSNLGKQALVSIMSNPEAYQTYVESLEKVNPELASNYRSSVEPILKEINSMGNLSATKRVKAAEILYDIRDVNEEIKTATTETVKNKKIQEKNNLEEKLNKLLEKPNTETSENRDRRSAIEAMQAELDRMNQQATDAEAIVENSANMEAGQQMTDRINFLEARMDSADYIDQSEIDESVNDLYNLWDRVDGMEDLSQEQKEATKAAIENKINKLEQYEFSTTTQAGQTVKTTAVKGVRVIGRTAKETPSKFQVTPERIAGQGDTTVTRADGSTANGTFILNDDGTIDVVIADGRTVDPRTGTVGVARIPVDSNFIEFVETQKDADGNVTGATIYDAKNNVSYAITDPDLALDMAIKAKTAALGPIEQAEFEQIIEEVERTTPARTTLKDGTEVSLSELNRRANEVANRIRQIENRLEGTISKSEKTKLKKELAKLKKERDAIQKQKTGKEVVRDRTKGRRKVGEKVQAEPKEPTGAGTAKQTEDGTQEEGGVADTKQTLMTDPMLSDASLIYTDSAGNTVFGIPDGAIKRMMDKSGISAKIKSMLDRKLITAEQAASLEEAISAKIRSILGRATEVNFTLSKIGSATRMFFYSDINDFYDSINSFGVNEDGTFRYGYPGARYGANPQAVDGLYSFDQLSGIGRIDINLSSLMDAYLNKLDDLQTAENPDGTPYSEFPSSIDNLGNVVDKVVAHEAAHAVLFKLFGDSPKLFKELRNKIAALVKDSVLTGKLRGLLPDGEVIAIEKYLENFSKKYNEADSYEEWLAELTGLLKMAGGLPTNAIKPTFKGKLLDILDTVISTLTGGKLRLKDYVRQDRVIEFFTSLINSLDQYNSEEIFLLKSSADAIARDAKGLLNSPQSLHFRGYLKEGQLSSTGRKPSVSSKASVKTVTPKIIDKTMLIGKTYSATLSDHTKVDCYFNKRTGVKVCGMMGGTMFPYIEEMEKLGYVWAAKDVGKIRSLIKNASGVDYTLVYRMNRSTGSLGNLDTAEAALAELDYVYNKLDNDGKENFLKLLNNRLASIESGRILFSDETINKKVIKYQKTDKKGNPAVGSKGNPLFAYKIPEGGGFSSYDEFKTAIKDQKLPFQTRAIWDDVFLSNDTVSPKNAWHQLLKDNGGATFKELVDNLAEEVTDQADDADIVSVLKIAEPEYDSRGNLIVYTPFENLVNEKKGIYLAEGAPKHRTYPYFAKGKPVGVLNEFNSVYEYFPYIKEIVESGRLKHPHKAIETMMKELLATFKSITGLTSTNRKPNIQEVVKAQQEFEKNPKNANIKSKASVVTFDHTGYVSTDFWVNSLRGNTKYLDDVLKNILSARAELMAGEVSPKKVVRAYLITVASQGSAGSTYDKWSGKREKKVNDLFVEMSTDPKGKKVKWIRPEGAAAAYLSTFEGEELVDALVAQTATKQQIRKLYDFVGFGYMSDKTDNTMKTMNTDGINNMTKLFLANKGTDFNELYKGAIKNFYGIGVGKTGFFNQYFGVASQGVVDARQMNAWVAGTMKLTDEQKERKAKISGSSALQKELLDRIYKVGIALGYPADVAGYLAHHAMWDGIKNSVTTHAGEYAVVSNGFMPGSMMTLPFSDKWSLSMSEAEIDEASGETYISSQDVDPGDSKISRAKKRYLDDLYRMWGKWFTSKFPDLGNMPILDIGSGLGQVHSKFAPRKKLNISTAEPSYDSGAFKEASGMNTPTYTRHDGTDIPTEAFDFVLNSGSISEYPADTRESVIRTAARAMKPGGVSVINAMTTEYTDLLSSQIKKDPKKGIILSDSEVLVNDNGKMTYIKGFKQSELEAYVKDVLGSNYNVITAPDGLKSMATVVVEKSPEITTLRQKASIALQDVESTAKALEGVDTDDIPIKKLYRGIPNEEFDSKANPLKPLFFSEDKKVAQGFILGYQQQREEAIADGYEIPEYSPIIKEVSLKADKIAKYEGDVDERVSDEEFLKRLNVDNNTREQIKKFLDDRRIGANISPRTEAWIRYNYGDNPQFFDILRNNGYDVFEIFEKGAKAYAVIDRSILKTKEIAISEAYHKAKADGSNPELVSAVESVVAQPTTPTIVVEKSPEITTLRQKASVSILPDGKTIGKFDPLPGAPKIEGITGPDPNLVEVAESYAKKFGIPYGRQSEYVQVNEALAKRLADAYEKMEHKPNDPKVKEAYENLIKQTKDQYDALIEAGYEFSFFDSNSDPYKGNPSDAMRDLRKNKKMAVYGTYDGYGTEGITGAAVDNNPMLAPTGLKWPDQDGVMRDVVANDLFRAVHDAFGHGLEGASFRARGEENAWQAHARLFTGSAVAAITSETRGQNSWLNFGPYGEKNRTAKIEETVFAEQKIGLLPEWAWTEGFSPSVPTPETRVVLKSKPSVSQAGNSETFFDEADVVFPNDHFLGGYAVTDEDGKLIGRILMSEINANTVKIDEVVAEKRGQRTGNGTKIMNMTVALADRHNITLKLTPNLIGSMKAKGFETAQKLREFYAKFGFVKDTGLATMTRIPKTGIVSKPSVQPRPDQLNVMERAGKEYTDNMVDDGNGNYVFYHVAPLDLSNDFIDPKFFGRNIRTGRDEQPGVNIAMYYTEPGKVDVGGDFTHIIRIPKNMVYPFNKDPLNFYDEAKRRFKERYPALAFDANKQVGFISQVAAENGYPLVVAKWGGVSPLRAQTAVAIKPELLKDKNQVYLPEVNELKKGESPIKSKESRADVTTINKKSFESNVQSEVDRIKALPVGDVDGATFNLDGTAYTGGGLVVPVGSKNTSQNRLSAEAIYNFMMSNKDNISSPIFKNGLFKFENSPTVSIDLNIVIPREYKEIGLVFGRLAGQKSLWDMDLMEEVDTGATGENPVTYTSEQYKEIARELAQGRIPDFVYTTAGETAPGKTKTATGRIKSKMSAAGERGVKQFHSAVEEGISIRFLSAAKNMENRFGITEGDWLRTLPEGSSIKRILSKIKLLTGYERGSDGKWRYEISDRDAKIIGESKLRKDLREDQEGVPLSDVLQHDELFKFYPELADLPVVMFRGYDFEFEAAYQRETNTMLVSDDLSGDVLKMKVLHEIQHYIQTREGFDTVGKKEMGNLQNNVLWGIGLDLDGYDSFMEAFDDALNSIQELILEGKSIVDIHDGYYTKFFFGKNPKQLMRYVVGGRTMDVLSKMSLDQQQAFFNKNILPELDDLKSMIEDGASEVYWNNISEIEARNIEKRMNMTNQELRESIMSDTEDMARPEQIAEKGYIRSLHDFLVTQEARVEEAAAERVSPVKTKIGEKPTEYLKTLLAAAVGKGVKALSATRRGNLTVSDFNALINGLVKYVQAQVRNAVASNNSYRLSDLIDDVRSVSSIDIDIATAAALFDEAGVTGTTFDPKIEEDVMRKSLIDAGFPPQMAAMLAKGDALYDYANSKRITKKSC